MRHYQPIPFAISLAAGSLIALLGPVSASHAQDVGASSSDTPGMVRSKALIALRDGDGETAVRMAKRLTELDAASPSAMLLAADIQLRCGDPAEAVLWFDRYLKTRPNDLPDLWQRGIALYFSGDFKLGTSQFEVHRKVNPNDVENAAWHFLCVAKSDSLDTAKQLVLPAPNDPRIPMEEVLAMLSSGDTEAVRQRMESVPPNTSARSDAEFYGNFYLGLYADAAGDSPEALRLLRLSAKTAPHHYMGDVARAYVKFLEKQVSKSDDNSPSH